MPEKNTYEEIKQRLRQLEKNLANRPLTNGIFKDNPKLVRDIIENSGALIVIKDHNSRNLLVNRKWEEVTGISRDQVLGKTDDQVFPPDIARQFRKNDLQVIESGETMEVEEILDSPEGPRFFISIKFPLRDDSGNVIGLCGIITDITARKRAEKALRENEQKYQSLFNNAQVALFKTSVDGRLLEINKRYATLAGYSSVQKCMDEFEPGKAWACPDSRTELVELLLKDGTVQDFEAEIIRKDGSRLWILFSARIYPESGVIEGSLVDISDLKRVEQSLRESETRFKALHNASFGGITIHDKGIILECNKGLSEITGYSVEELIGMDGMLLIAEKSRDLVMGNILRGYEKPYEAFGVRKNAEEYPIRLESRNIPYKGKMVRTSEFRDITESKLAEEERIKLQEQLIQAQKMESVGRLAGGVAHDFNNMLGVILGYTELALENVDESSTLHTNLREIRYAATRSMEITKQLLAFARQQTVAPRILDLNDTIQSMLKMLQRLIGEDIQLDFEPEPQLWTIRMDPTQIDQILANLCVNSRDAIQDVGKITITTRNVCIDNLNSAGYNGIPPGEFVLLTFRDDGCGMTQEVLDNLFEPFYTTKSVNEGTGLGLSTVYGIVKQNQGFITVDSEPEKGTTFNIYMPRSQSGGTHVETQTKQILQEPGARGNETILLVEDEPGILFMIKAILQKLGYTVLVAETPRKAIDMTTEYTGKINLLITDVIMPEMNGRDLVDKLTTLYPNLKYLFMSGYTADVIGHHGVLDQDVQFLQKPFTKQDLAVKVREILDLPISS